jgi:hypothetical protein
MGAPRSLRSAALALLLLATPAIANANPSAKLTYIRGSGCEQCPDEAHLRRAVAARLGYDPFFPWAKQTVITELERGEAGYVGRVRIIDSDGVTRGERKLAPSGSDCVETVNALALAISIGIDDLGRLDAAAEPDGAAAASPTGSLATGAAPPPTDPVPPATREPADSASSGLTPTVPSKGADGAPRGENLGKDRRAARVMPFVSARAHGALGLSPSPAVGSSVAVGLRRGVLSGAIEGRADLAASTTTSLGTVSSSTYLASLVPCVHLGTPFACLVAGVGSFAYRGADIAMPRHSSAFLAALGVRLGAELPLSASLSAFASADVLANVTPHRVQIDGVDVYGQPILCGALGIGLAAHFP